MTDMQRISAPIGSGGARGACLLDGRDGWKSQELQLGDLLHQDVAVTIVTTTSIILFRSDLGDDETKVHNVGHVDMLSEHEI